MATTEVEVAEESVNNRLVYSKKLHDKVIIHQINLSQKKKRRVTLEQATIDLIEKGIKVAGV